MRTYILDTNVLLSDPKSMFVFEEHNIIIPMWALEEIDKFKTEMNERGYNARTVSRYLDKLRQRGSLGDGVPLNGGGTLRVEWDKTLPSHREGYVDNAIIRLAKKLTEDHPDQDIRLVSRDTNMRVKADALGIKAENYKHDEHTDLEKQYGGVREVFAFGADIDAFYRGEDVSDLIPEGIHPHEFLVLKSETQSAVARFDGKQLVRIPKHEAFGIAPRNKEQLFALDLLLNPNIPLVTISGQAGCGKTLLAMAAGLRMTADEMQFRKLLVSRPVVPMGRDIGFLPGILEEKMAPWMQPIFDNLEILVPGNGKSKGSKEPSYNYLIDQGMLQVEALTFIRGRSLPKMFFLVDEAQNLSAHEIKTIVTRIGEGAKLVFTGDPSQIDNPYVDARTNGLTHVIERFKDSPIAGHITMRKGERSLLAEEAAKRL